VPVVGCGKEVFDVKKMFLIAIVAALSVILCGCGHSRTVTGDRNGAEEIGIILSDLAGNADLGLNIYTYDISVTDVEEALTYLDMYVDGDYVSQKKLRDSIKYLKRYVEAVDDQFTELDNKFQEVF
jgi:uncharacterized lipoprotein YehR (DUF1307 family)